MDVFDRNTVRKTNIKYLIPLCLACLFINWFGAHLAEWLHLPLYLDNIGSALAAALGGFVPGIIVGFLSNLINCIGNYDTIYYGFLTILIAVCSAWFAGRGDYRKPLRLPLIILVFAFIGGVIGSLLTGLLYGFTLGEVPQSAALAQSIYSSTSLGEFWSQFSADVLIDLLDKTITVLMVAGLLYLIPASLKNKFVFTFWRQEPLSAHDLEKSSKFTRRKSLRRKVVLLVTAATLFTGIAVTFISYQHFRDASIADQLMMADGVVSVIADSFDHDRVDEYLEKGRDAEGYAEAEAVIARLMFSSEYVEYCYVYRILPDGCHVVFDPDPDPETGASPGDIVPFDEAFRYYVSDLLMGKEIKPITSNETYGWLLTLYKPVYDSNGVCQCYAAVDINMDHIAEDGRRFIVRVISLFLAVFIMLLTITIWLAEYNIVLPINSMALEAGRFSFDTEQSRASAIENIEKLHITTGDEIQNLYTAMIKTTREMSRTAEDMAKAIAETQRQGALIGKLQNGLILVLADMVESRDENTGEHVRKTSAYTGVIMRQLRREHIYEDQLTDDFIRDVMNSAPLHDVGKIQVPDKILNKPGKLSDEEFEIMKKHTIAGAEIIESAMNMVSEKDSGYLKEARNLAMYHHEKWNGKGYPHGLKGEEIPLSARVMAVADVFDALVSKRSYKDGFPFEKAMDIIREGCGQHFDPAVAGAFIHAEDEVRKIMISHMER